MHSREMNLPSRPEQGTLCKTVCYESEHGISYWVETVALEREREKQREISEYMEGAICDGSCLRSLKFQQSNYASNSPHFRPHRNANQSVQTLECCW